MLGSILHEVKSFVNKHDDDLVDRYNHRYTVMILAVFIFVIATKQYFNYLLKFIYQTPVY
jgi:hypothetical protein